MDYKIRSATREELNIAVEWAAKEGWNPGLYDGDSFYTTDPRGFFLGFLDNEPIASISAVSYGKNFGFLGFYIVKQEYRNREYGMRIWNEALKHLPTQNIGLDGVIAQQENYKKSGFKLAYSNIRYEGKGIKKESNRPDIIPLSQISFEKLLAYDNQIFPASRPTFLRLWIRQPESLSLGVVKDGNLSGYGMVRKCRAGFKIGPLFADTEKVADMLFQAMRSFVGKNSIIFLDVPEVNGMAINLAERYNMNPMFRTARMYTKKPPNTPINKVFGVTSFELG